MTLSCPCGYYGSPIKVADVRENVTRLYCPKCATMVGWYQSRPNDPEVIPDPNPPLAGTATEREVEGDWGVPEVFRRAFSEEDATETV